MDEGDSGVRRIRCDDPVGWTALAELTGDLALADPLVLEAIASDHHARVVVPDPTAAADAAGCTLRFDPVLPDGIEAALFASGVIVARPHRDPRRILLAVLHEVAHWLLSRARVLHSHADVWYLTLALAAPLPLLNALRRRGELSIETLADAVPAPVWALAARLDMPSIAA